MNVISRYLFQRSGRTAFTGRRVANLVTHKPVDVSKEVTTLPTIHNPWYLGTTSYAYHFRIQLQELAHMMKIDEAPLAIRYNPTSGHVEFVSSSGLVVGTIFVTGEAGIPESMVATRILEGFYPYLFEMFNEPPYNLHVTTIPESQMKLF